MVTIITTHMPRNDSAAPGHVWPGTRIHAIDIVQPPGIAISPIADIDAHQTIVSVALDAKSSTETPRKARSEISRRPIALMAPMTGSPLVVLVVAAPPDARLVAPPGCAVEPLLHAPDAVHSARVAGIRVVDDAVVEHECAHARPFARVRGLVGSAHGREGSSPLADGRRLPWVLAPVVVLDTLALLLRGEPDGEVGVEFATERRR